MTEAGATALAGTTRSSALSPFERLPAPIDCYPGRLGGAMEVTHV
jgi:hypothetical protein